MGDSAIEWTDTVWNPVTGCDRVSPGCAHCYALDLAPRLRRFARAREQKAFAAGRPYKPGKWLNVRDGGKSSGPAFGVTLHPDVLDEPLRWRRPRRVFVNSMSDLFHDEVPDRFIAQIFGVMGAAERHTFQVLTKRPERMRSLLSDPAWMRAAGGYDWPLPNVWLGVSIENRRFVDRADILRATPAAVRFISAEPLLGPLLYDDRSAAGHYATAGLTTSEIVGDTTIWQSHWRDDFDGDELDLDDIDWLIVGGESGPGARPMDLQWVRDLRDAAQAPRLVCCGLRDELRRCCEQPDNEGQQTAFFLKQVGGPRPGGKLEDLPEDLRIRDMPVLQSAAQPRGV